MQTLHCFHCLAAADFSSSVVVRLSSCNLLGLMGPRRCAGLAEADGAAVVCCFNPWRPGTPAQGKYEGHCVWCSPARLHVMSEDSRLRKLLAAALVELHRLDETVYQQARGRVEAFAPKRFAEILARHETSTSRPSRPRLLRKKKPPSPLLRTPAPSRRSLARPRIHLRFGVGGRQQPQRAVGAPCVEATPPPASQVCGDAAAGRLTGACASSRPPGPERRRGRPVSVACSAVHSACCLRRTSPCRCRT